MALIVRYFTEFNSVGGQLHVCHSGWR